MFKTFGINFYWLFYFFNIILRKQLYLKEDSNYKSKIKKTTYERRCYIFSAVALFTTSFQAPCKTYYFGNDSSALSDAIYKNDTDRFSDLISKTNPNELEKLAYCFMCAVVRSRLRICEIILEKNRNIINTKYDGRLPLYHAARWDLTNVIDFLLRHGASINDQSSNNGYTALHQAALHRHYDECKFLIENGADVNARNNAGETPMHLAALENADPFICKLLTICGADFNAIDINGRKPIDLAWDNFKQPLISNQPCSQDSCRQYIRDNNISECPICNEKKLPDEFMCIYNCTLGQNGPSYEHAICQDCLKRLYLINEAGVCPFCRQGIAPHDAQR